MTDHIKDGGPAFPNLAPDSFGPRIAKREGMTLRDYFAAQVISALIAASRNSTALNLSVPLAFKIADEMLVEREKSVEDQP